MTRSELLRKYLQAKRALTINRDSVCVRMLTRLGGRWRYSRDHFSKQLKICGE